MRMIQSRDSLHFTMKETHIILHRGSIRISFCLSTHDFDGNLPIDTCVFCQVDFAHASAPNTAHKAVMSEQAISWEHSFTSPTPVDQFFSYKCAKVAIYQT